MAHDSGLLELIARLYDVPHVPSAWPAFLEAYAAFMSADVAAIQIHRFDRGTSEVLASFGLASPLRASYNEHYAPMNIFREKGRHLYLQGTVLFDEQICPRATLERSAFFNEFLVPLGGVYSASGIIERTPDHAVVIAALRGTQRRQWSADDLLAMQRLLPHIVRARQLEGLSQLLAVSLGALDALDVGVVLARAPAEVVYANRIADAIFTRGDGLTVSGRSLVAGDANSDALLRAAIALATAADADDDGAGAIPVVRQSLKRSYQVMVSPLRHVPQPATGLAAPHAMLVVIDPAAQRVLPPRALQALYSLTKREAALAAALARGQSLQASSAALGMQYETARSHLRRIFDKTGTSRQSELVVLLAQISALTG